MVELPTGTVTFLLTDVEGSTALWEQASEAMRTALARHDALFEAAVVEHGGDHIRPRGEGDSRFAVFTSATNALAAAVAIQRSFAFESWPTPTPIKVRIGVHTGEAQLRDDDYYGAAVNRCARLRNLGHGGQILLSEATAALTRERLPDGAGLLDLGCHRLRGLTEPERVFQVSVPDLRREFPALTSPDARPNNLPLQPTALLGREREVGDICGLLQGDARLVTLTGPGGTGKTRLSLQVAAELLDALEGSAQAFEHGIFFVELAPIRDPSLVPSTIARVLDVRDTGSRSILDSLKEYLRSRSLMLVLDNLEQVVAAAPVVSELLTACAGLKVLVSSREPLRVRGEHEYAVLPLALPDAYGPTTPEAVSRSPAVELFVLRARGIRAEFEVTDENAADVAEICTRLDGLPLAIELAAARVRLLTPQAIARRLERRLPLLVGGARDLPTRQQTLRDTIIWSYDLLNDAERRLFQYLAVFVGGWTLVAAEAICTSKDHGIDVMGGLESLISKSLVRLLDESGGEPRFAMLETIRELGLERLESGGDVEAVRRRHRDWFADLAEREVAQLNSPGQVDALKGLTADYDNLCLALDTSMMTADGWQAGARIVGALAWFWMMRGRRSEGQEWVAKLLPSMPVGSAAWASVLLAGGILAGAFQGDSDAEPMLIEGLETYRALESRRGIMIALSRLGRLHLARQDNDRAWALLTESRALFEEVGGDLGLDGPLEMFLAQVAKDRGELERATSLFEESLVLLRRRGQWHAVQQTSRHLGELALLRHDHAGAAIHLQASLELSRESEDLPCSLSAIELFAQLALDQGDIQRAVHLLAAAGALGETRGVPLSEARRVAADRREREARAALGDREFAATWSKGSAMTLEQAVAYALEDGP